MKRWLVSLLFLPVSALALSYEADTLPYTDVPDDHATKIAISVLTELEIVQGNPDGTYKPGVPINRAEFMKIAMGLLPRETVRISSRCFPDVDPNIWFAFPVCRAKAMGIVSGNALPGVDKDLWPFEPTRSVKYEEALKILFRIYGFPLVQGTGGEWYEKYVQTAIKEKIDLQDAAVGSALTRGQMSRLVLAFIALSRGELDELRYAETHPDIPVRTVFEAPEPSVSSAPAAVSTTSASSASTRQFDPLIDDTTVDEAVLVLGKVTHVLGAAELFADAEPIIVEKFMIDVVTANSSLDSMKLYDHDGVLIGRATLDTSVAGNKRYTLRMKSGEVILPYRDDYSFYVRGVLRSQESGGTSGGSIQVDQMGVSGIGKWSSRDYEQFTSGETFAKTTVARSAITTIKNAGPDREILTPGDSMQIGAFRFEGVVGHSAARLQLESIDFTLGLVGDVTITNPFMRADGSSDSHTCTIAGTTITCASLPDSFSRLDDGPRVLRVYADVSVSSGSQSAGVQLSINDPGTVSAPGDITWTDGVTSFTFVDTGFAPVARGTYYSY